MEKATLNKEGMEVVLCMSEGSMPRPYNDNRPDLFKEQKVDRAAEAKMDGERRVGAGVRSNRGPGIL